MLPDPARGITEDHHDAAGTPDARSVVRPARDARECAARSWCHACDQRGPGACAGRDLSAGAKRAGAGRGAQARRRAHPRARERTRRRAGTAGSADRVPRQHARCAVREIAGIVTGLGADRAPGHGSAGQKPVGLWRGRSRADAAADAATGLWAARLRATRNGRLLSRHRGGGRGWRDWRGAADEQLPRHVRRSSVAGVRRYPVGRSRHAPWNSGASGSDLAREAGIDDVGRSGRVASLDDGDNSQRAGLFDTANNDDGDAGGGFDSGGDSDTA